MDQHRHTDDGAPAPLWVSMRHLQRAAAFARGADMHIDDLLEASNLGADQLGAGDSTVPLETVEALLCGMQRRYPDPTLALRMAAAIQPSTLGALGYVMQACLTVADLLEVGTRFNGLMSNFGCTSIHHQPGVIDIRWECMAGSPGFRQHSTEYILATCVTLGRLLIPGASEPMAVRFQHARPTAPHAVRAHFDFFRCPVYFDAPFSSITVPASLASMRLPHGDAVLKDLLEQHAQQLLKQRSAPTSLSDDVRRLLKSLILSGTPTKEAIAQQLGISARSLHRRLQDAGTSYQALLDDIRTALAQERLGHSDVPIADIAAQLGFSSPQTFMRWFRQVLGVTPGQYRCGLPDVACAPEMGVFEMR